MKRAILLLPLLLLSPARIASADLAPLEITEEDASPSTFPYKVKFSNGSVTDNGDGTISVSAGGGGITIGTTAITSGTDTRVLFDDAGVIGEDAGFTYVKGTDALTVVGVVTAGDVTLSSAAPSLVFTDSAGDDFEHDLTSSVYRIVNTTDGVTAFLLDANNEASIGEQGKEVANFSVRTTATGNGSVRLPNDSIGPQELDAVDEPSNGESYVFNAASGRGEWASGGSGNSFETISVPAGTAPVADSASDTLTITETSFLTITGTAATDTLDITQVTTDLGTDGLIAANAVALGTDTTNDYVATVADGTGIDGTTSGETATYTPTLDLTEINSATFGSGTFTSLAFNGSGNDYELALEVTQSYYANTTSGAIIWRANTQDQFVSVANFKALSGVDLRGVVDLTNSSVVAQTLQISRTVVDPDAVQTTSDAVPLLDVDAFNFPFGIRIDHVVIGTNTGATLSYTLEEWTSPTSGVSSVITGLPLIAASERTFTSFADPTVAAGAWVFLNLDTTALNWFTITVRFHALTA